MKYVSMGNSGLKLTEVTFGSALTIGTQSTDQSYANEMIDTAWRLGIRSFDVSNNYGAGAAEKLVGKALWQYGHEEYVVATKGSWPIGDSPYHRGLSRKHILWAFEKSLNNLGLDYIDIYYAHRYDPEVPMEEIVRTFNYLINTGRIRYWATSEWPVSALEECHQVCDRLQMEKPVIEQSIYSFAVRKIETNGVKDFCSRKKVGMLGFSPLCQGILTGKYRDGVPDDSRIAKSKLLNYDKTINFYTQNRQRIDRYLELCDIYSLKPADVAIKWGIRSKIYPVLGASKPEQLYDTLGSLNQSIPDEIWNKFEEV